jgi:hypothetical protein
MKIFAVEIEDGLEEVLKTQASISYASQLEPAPPSCSKPINIKALAGISDKDLYYTQSILVTTSWNKNDDIFDREEVWAAKNTPIHKPTNLEHDESTIVGHITSNWPITNDGILIDESTPTENLPNKYHILTGSVIYNGYTEQELKERAQKLIAEIENGTKYVSMECFFKAFDYGLINKSTGEYKILSRNNETAFLTKHLRAYGGLGEYQDHKVGRVLRQITFSGKGFVDKPANPESIIFTKNSINFNKNLSIIESDKEKKSDFSNIGVFSIQANLKENEMSLETDIIELKNKIETMNNFSEQLAQANSTILSLKEEISNIKTETEAKDKMTQEYLNKMNVSEEDKKKMKAKFDEDLAQAKADADNMGSEYATKIEDLNQQIESLKSELLTKNEALAVYKNKEEEMMKKEKQMKRMATLIETGFDTELANATVSKFENLDDELFSGMTEVFAAMMTKKKMAEEETKKNKMSEEALMKKKASEEESEILETAETEETIDLTVGGEDQVSEVENTRAALVDFVYNRLGKKLNKGE